MTDNPLLNELIRRSLNITIIVVVSIVAWFGLRYVIQLASKSIQRLDGVEDSEFDHRAKTIFRFVRSVAIVIIVVTMVITILGELQINIAPLIASVGVAGLALGLGAQTLVKDAIAGLFILLEDQFSVGDAISVGGVSGAVEELSLRTTHIRDLNGTLHIVPNGEIRIVSNSSKGWSRARLELLIPYEEDVLRVKRVLHEELEHLANEHGSDLELLEPFSLTGPEELGDWGVRLRILGKVKPGEQWGLQRILRQHVLDAFKKHGIQMVRPRQEIMLLTPDELDEKSSGGDAHFGELGD